MCKWLEGTGKIFIIENQHVVSCKSIFCFLLAMFEWKELPVPALLALPEC